MEQRSFEKIIVVHVLKESLVLYNPKTHCRVYKDKTLDPNQGCISHLIRVKLNLPLRLSKHHALRLLSRGTIWR